MADESRPGVDPERVLFGAGLILLGLALFAYRNGWLDLVAHWRWWPLVLVALGAVKMLRKKGRGEGVWLAFLGLLVLGQTLHVLPFSQSWPLFVIWAGASVTWNALRGRREGSDGR